MVLIRKKLIHFQISNIAGTLCVIDLSRFSCYGYDQRIEVFGTKGMICSENMKPNSTVVSDGSGSSMSVD